MRCSPQPKDVWVGMPAMSRFSPLSSSAALGLVLVCWQSAAHANLWDAARNPRAARAEELLMRADRARVPADPTFEAAQLQRKLNERSAVMIRLANGHRLGDPRLLFLLGDCLVHSAEQHVPEGRRVLLQALAMEPSSPLAAEAWFDVAIASSWMRDHALEFEAYTKALERESDQEQRARIYLNRGESSMAQGNLKRAQQDYRIALYETSSAITRALANWGLAVALDRAHDFPAAAHHAIAASHPGFGPSGNQVALDLPGVFFTPKYEIHYYRALAAQARADRTRDAIDRIAGLQTAKLLWLTYLGEAQPDGPWVPRVRQHLQWLDRELKSVVDDPLPDD